MTRRVRAAAAPEQQNGPVEQTVLAADATITPPVISDADTAGTITATPAPTPQAAPAPEPITHPAEGGSYVRDPATGHLTRLED